MPGRPAVRLRLGGADLRLSTPVPRSPTLQAIAQLLGEARRRDLAYAASKRALDLS